MMADEIREIKLIVFQQQAEVIKIQSDVIDELLKLLLMHMKAEDVERLPEIEKMNDAAKIRAELDL